MAERAAADSGAFARDLGYLGAFFDKLEAHAKTLGGARGARLSALIGEERARWNEIRGLLSGANPAPTAGPATAAPANGGPVKRGAAAMRQGEREMTVGSLRGKPRG